MGKLTTRDYKSTQRRSPDFRRLREFGYGILAGIVVASMAFVYLGGPPRRPKDSADAPRLGLNLAPAGDVEGAGERGVVVTAVDPDGTAAEHGVKTGDVILNVGGKAVSNVGDVRAALRDAKADGKHSVLMQVKTADATRFVAVPFASAKG